MTTTRRATLLALAALPAAGCASHAVEDNRLNEPAFDPPSWFEGRTDAFGLFETVGGRARFGFRTWLEGARTADGFTLRERFVYDTGERWERTWRFAARVPGRWTAQAQNTVGLGALTAAGDAARMTYTADMPSGGKLIRLGFDQLLHRVGPLVVNRSEVSKFGVKIGRITMVFVKPGRSEGPGSGIDTGDADAIGALPPFPVPTAR